MSESRKRHRGRPRMIVGGVTTVAAVVAGGLGVAACGGTKTVSVAMPPTTVTATQTAARTSSGTVADVSSQLQTAVGKKFEQVFGHGYLVDHVDCFQTQNHQTIYSCRIIMVADNPDPGYFYVVTVTPPNAYRAVYSPQGETGNPPQSFTGIY